MDKYAEAGARGRVRFDIDRICDIAQWVLVVAAFLLNIVVAPVVGHPLIELLFVAALPFIALHGIRRNGVRAFLVFVCVTLVVSNAYENCSILTGFPFGRYYYTGGPKLFLVPVTIGVFYIAIGYLAWQTASALLGQADRHLERAGNVVILPAIAAAVQTMFDLTTDPFASTYGQTWIWLDGGGYFGVPASNFVGWWLCTFSFFVLFAIYLRAQRRAHRGPVARAFRVQPILLYFNLGLVNVINLLLPAHPPAVATARNGVTWRTADINEGAFTVFLFTMAVVTVLALARVLADGRSDARQETPASADRPVRAAAVEGLS